ncbi:MAG: type II toxin-antitoxin system RelE/ParE family toxin [Actinomycetota bacterium]|nr:type II toxin-antitoxin system RelE/ParE family toxin [Actinomycetota bacterium]
MTYQVIFAPETEDQLDEMYRYIADAATAEIADRYISQIIDYCEGLAVYPIRGATRDDIRPGLRTTSFKKRTVIAFAIADDVVSILGIFHGRRDYESALALPEQ